MVGRNKTLLATSLGILALAGIGLATWSTVSNRGSSSSFPSVVHVAPNVEKSVYDVHYSEERHLRGQVSKYENFLAYWVSTYIGKVGENAQNTSSLIVNELVDAGEFNGLDTLYLKYPTLNGVVSGVRVSYYYDSDAQNLVQVVTVERGVLGDERSVFVTYDRSAVVVDYWVSTDFVDGGA